MGLACLGIILFAGWLIGTTGIGGVLIVPTLTQVEGISPPQALAASSTAFVFPAMIALFFLFMRRIHMRNAVLLAIGALPGAVLGATLVHHLDAHLLLIPTAILLFFGGFRLCVDLYSVSNSSDFVKLPLWALLVTGAIVGTGSALTGTGGPILLSPLLLILRQPLPSIIASANAIQMPVAIASGLVHWQSGALDLGLTTTIGLILLAGSVAGQNFGAIMRPRQLQHLVAILLLGTGCWFSWILIS